MAYYSYKEVRDLLPDWVTNEIEDYEGDPGYDGDQWTAAANYIDWLQNRILELNPDFSFNVKS